MAAPIRAKKITGIVKLQIAAGKATPAPPVGPALGQKGVGNIADFCKQFNAATQGFDQGAPIPVVVQVYQDKSFSFTIKSPSATYMLKKAAGIGKGSSTTGRNVAGTVEYKDIVEIAKAKMEDLNAIDVENAARIIAGTARSIGITIINEDENGEKTA